MNNEQIRIWKEATQEHISSIKTILAEDKEIKKMFVEHLRQFFDGFEAVDFSRDFKKVTMRWKWHDDVGINKDTIGDFEMDWIVTNGASADGGSGINVVVYPFGRGD